jgi:hypothetical protein
MFYEPAVCPVFSPLLQPTIHNHPSCCHKTSIIDIARKVRNNQIFLLLGARGSVVVKALCYKPEGRMFDSR